MYAKEHINMVLSIQSIEKLDILFLLGIVDSHHLGSTVVSDMLINLDK